MTDNEPKAVIQRVDLNKSLAEVLDASGGDSVVICRDGVCRTFPRAMIPTEVHDFIDLHEDK